MSTPKKHIAPFSFGIAIIAIILQTIDSFVSGSVTQFFQLTPTDVLVKGEFWRTILYPFATSSLADTALMIFAFTVCSAYFEKVFRSRLYPILLAIVSVFYGLLYTLLFLNFDVPLTGFASVGFFLLTFYTLVKIRNRYHFSFANIRVFWVSLLVLLLWAALTVPSIVNAGVIPLVTASTSLIFGMTTGTLSFLFIRYLYNKKRSPHDERQTHLYIPRPEELTPAFISSLKIERIINKDKEDFYNNQIPISSDPEENEENLNRILDKISSDGKDSLTEEEQLFLDQYSQQL